MFKVKELTEEQVKQLRESKEGQLKLAKAFGISHARVKLIKEAPSFEEAMKIGKGVKEDREKPPGAAKTGTKVVTEGEIPLMGLGGEKPPLVLTLEGEKIPLNTMDMVRSYLFFKFLKDKLQLQSDFSSTIAQLFSRTCVQVGTTAVIEDKEVKIVEVAYGRTGRETSPTGDKPAAIG